MIISSLSQFWGNFELNLFSLTSPLFSSRLYRQYTEELVQREDFKLLLDSSRPAINSIFLNGFFSPLVQMNLKMQPILISWSRTTFTPKTKLTCGRFISTPKENFSTERERKKLVLKRWNRPSRFSLFWIVRTVPTTTNRACKNSSRNPKTHRSILWFFVENMQHVNLLAFRGTIGSSRKERGPSMISKPKNRLLH